MYDRARPLIEAVSGRQVDEKNSETWDDWNALAQAPRMLPALDYF